MPCNSALQTGMRISLHNDPPVTPEEPLRNISVAVTRVAPSGRVIGPEEPLRNISVAVTRTAPSGRVIGPEQRITVDQAIRAQTIDAAWQLHSDDVIGSLEVGKYADFAVLSDDPLAVAGEDIAAITVRETWVDGERRHRA